MDQKKQKIEQEALRRIQSRDLFKDQRCLIIEHEGADYRLQITRQKKLILTK